MKISANPPAAVKPPSRAMMVPPEQAKGGTDGFARLLRGAGGRGAAEALLPDIIAGGNSRFEVETQIGDDAVRFDARPIVAPTGAAEAPGDGAGAKSGVTAGEALPGAAPAHADLLALVGQLARRLPDIADGPLAGRAWVAASQNAPAAPGRPIRIAASPVGRPPAPDGRESLPLTVRVSDDAAARPSTPPSPAHTNALTARLAALPREILVVLRGVTLSPDERETLIDAVRRELTPLRLGERTIRIVGAGGTA